MTEETKVRGKGSWRGSREFNPKSTVIGTTRLAEMYGETTKWARAMLLEWYENQTRGGPIKVFKRGKKGALYTTISILQREMPPARDQLLVRQMAELDRDLTTQVRRIDALMTDVAHLRKTLGANRLPY